MQLEEPPSEKRLTRIVCRNLQSAYRQAMDDECPKTVVFIEKHGLRYERGRELDAKIEKGGKEKGETANARVSAVNEEKQTNSKASSVAKKPAAQQNSAATIPVTTQVAAATPTVGPGTGGSAGACYVCNEIGHRARDCPRTRATDVSSSVIVHSNARNLRQHGSRHREGIRSAEE